MGKHAKMAALLSVLFMGIGQLYNKQIIKGIIFILTEILALYLMVTMLIEKIYGLITLGSVPTHLEKVGRVYVNIPGDHSIFMLLEGLISLIILLLFIAMYVSNIKDAYKNGQLREKGLNAPNFHNTIRNINDNSFPYAMLFIPGLGILLFTIVPIIFMIFLAFTNYTAPNHIPPKSLVDWVGLSTFKDLLFLKQWKNTIIGVSMWTIVWAVLSTFTCYLGGILVALLIQQKRIKFKVMWRMIYIIPYAIPQFISLLVMRNMLNYQFGPINQYLRYFGLGGLPWLNDPFWAKVTIIIVNMWIGIPSSMLLTIGLLGNIPKDLYEAADVDGASKFAKFRSITLPYILFATAPLLIMSFAFNINNFNVIYLLTEGLPANGDYVFAGSTDLLVTWLYKLALDNQRYNIASAVGLIVFILIASLSIYNFRRTKSYKEEDMVQ
ncbi:arabinogalactan oligomer/maltooligosaccharide transport system permease protein [Fontibacillus solani]|uniref:Maltose/maltodextrin transport system permease protein n=1 Tax=Fontibacillus solani TaxID=1572857 RepID=A0A7W3SZ57_9BACL|nr:sugar ABC transporter permease [Fontibacillus solani]MBA9088843.1 arabinogalactan oligomer/maltooligosaccharide transport system permease protein [Fontibacillus solani]